MTAIIALIFQYMPLVFQAVQTVETISAAMATKPTGTDKLKAAIGLVGVTAPAIASAVNNQPENATHLENVVSAVVTAFNAMESWGEAVSQPIVPMVAGSGTSLPVAAIAPTVGTQQNPATVSA